MALFAAMIDWMTTAPEASRTLDCAAEVFSKRFCVLRPVRRMVEGSQPYPLFFMCPLEYIMFDATGISVT